MLYFLELPAFEPPRLRTVYTRANEWRWETSGSTGWVGAPAEAAGTSLAKTSDVAAKIEAELSQPDSAK